MRPEAPEDPKEYRRWLLRRFGLPALFVLTLFVVLWMRRADPTTDPWQTVVSGPTMGTTWSVKVVTQGQPDAAAVGAIKKAAAEAVEAVNASMSTYLEDSELSRFNTSETKTAQTVSPMLMEVMVEALDVWTVTDGAFDVTVGPVVNAWGFGPDKDVKPPTEKRLAELKARVGSDKLTLDAQASTLAKTRSDVYVDLSAIAKGYGVDRVAAALTALGYDNFMVDIGGEIRVKGRNKAGKPWRIGVEMPKTEGNRRVHTAVPLDDKAMATSGDYRNYIEYDGKRLSHTIDPRTGRPVEHGTASVTVIDDTCMTADALATALMVLGPKEGMALANAKGWTVMMLVRQADGFTALKTPSFEALTMQSP